MTKEQKSRAQLAVGLTALFAGAAALMVWLLPGTREIDYLIAGTFASALTLTAAFALFVTGRL